MKTIKDINLAEKTVLLRADYNVPLEDGVVADDYRLQQSLPTLRYLLERGCHIVLMSHLGRPAGERDPEYSLRSVATRLSELLEETVELADDIDSVDAGSCRLTLLENIRFWPEEEANDRDFAQRLARLGEVFVQDCFGVVHRSHASIVAITEFLPSVAGFLLEKEVETITQAMENPKRPLVSIFGGAKISDKIQVVERFVDKADALLIGGAMANSFMAYDGLGVGKSKYEADQEEVIEKLIDKARARDTDAPTCRQNEQGRPCIECARLIKLPSDVAVAHAVDKSEARRVVRTDEVAADEYILDIGDETIESFKEELARAGTIIWNGPVGMTELPGFKEGSLELARTIAESDAFSIIGGGDTASFLHHNELVEGFDWISTGGGAALDLMAGKQLPGVAALEDTPDR